VVPKTYEEYMMRYDVSKAGRILEIMGKDAGAGKNEGRDGVRWYKTMEESTRDMMAYFREKGWY
jgi:hypothetical protein